MTRRRPSREQFAGPDGSDRPPPRRQCATESADQHVVLTAAEHPVTGVATDHRTPASASPRRPRARPWTGLRRRRRPTRCGRGRRPARRTRPSTRSRLPPRRPPPSVRHVRHQMPSAQLVELVDAFAPQGISGTRPAEVTDHRDGVPRLRTGQQHGRAATQVAQHRHRDHPSRCGHQVGSPTIPAPNFVASDHIPSDTAARRRPRCPPAPRSRRRTRRPGRPWPRCPRRSARLPCGPHHAVWTSPAGNAALDQHVGRHHDPPSAAVSSAASSPGPTTTSAGWVRRAVIRSITANSPSPARVSRDSALLMVVESMAHDRRRPPGATGALELPS